MPTAQPMPEAPPVITTTRLAMSKLSEELLRSNGSAADMTVPDGMSGDLIEIQDDAQTACVLRLKPAVRDALVRRA